MPSKPEHLTRTEVPISCGLGPDDGSARLARWSALSDLATPVAHLPDGELEVRYRALPGVQEELESLALAEQECCSFVVTWVVHNSGGQPILRVIPPADSPDAVDPIAAMFAVDVSTASSPGVGS